MVLVNACCRTLTAFSHGEFPCCAKAGAARSKVTATAATFRNPILNRYAFLKSCFIRVRSFGQSSCGRVLAGSVGGSEAGTGRRNRWSGFDGPVRAEHTWTLGSYQRVSIFAPGLKFATGARCRAADRGGAAPRGLWGESGENSPHIERTKRIAQSVARFVFC